MGKCFFEDEIVTGSNCGLIRGRTDILVVKEKMPSKIGKAWLVLSFGSDTRQCLLRNNLRKCYCVPVHRLIS